MRLASVIIFSLLILGCSQKKEVASTTPSTPEPSWVQSRPISTPYYIGIGVAQKSPGLDYRRTAKENALSDLASEIRVNVNSNSLLYTLEREYKFEQEFRETIRTQTNIDLEEFEIVDQWEDSNSYWVYYRLNKADYEARLNEKRKSAQELALDFLGKAKAAENRRQYSEAADNYLRGLQAIEEFWNEKNEVSFQGAEILLGNELFTGLNSLLKGVRLELESPIELSYENRYKTDAIVLVKDLETGDPFEGVPLDYIYLGQYGRIKGSRATNADGRAFIPIVDADKEASNNTLTISIDEESVFEPYQGDRFMRKLLESLRGAELTRTIVYRPPSVYLKVKETNLGKSMAGQPITSALMASLSRRGVVFVNNPQEANLLFDISASTSQSGQDHGFSHARLELVLEVTESKSGQTVYKVSKSGIKGVDLDFERAGQKAYQNITRNIESELMRELVSSLF